jgi:hypothetical protein
MTVHHYASSIAWIVALVAYIACGRVARRSPQFGGGTAVLSWIGFFVPCIAWIVMFQGYTALDRAMAAAPSPANQQNKRQYVRWAIAYVVASIIAGAFAARR